MRRVGPALFIVLVLVLSGCLGGKNRPDAQPPDATGPVQAGSLSVDFDFEPEQPTVGQPVQFTDRSSDMRSTIVERAWDFGDGRGSTQRDPSHVYESPGVYRVTLRVKTEARVDASVTHLLAVKATAGPGVPPVPGVGAYLQFGTPVVVQPSDGGEPSIAIDSEGRIFVNPIGRLYRSTDGQKFTELSYTSVTSGDSHVIVDADDRVWVSDLGGVTPALYGSITVWSSENHGDDFDTGNPAASDTVLNDRQWLAASKGGVGYLVYGWCQVLVPVGAPVVGGPGCLTVSGSVLSKTIDGGLTWTLLPQHSFPWQSFPFTGPDGTLYVVGADGADPSVRNQITVYRSTDEGLTFDGSVVAQRKTNTANIFLNGATDAAGNVYVTWADKDTDQYDIWMSYSTDKGNKWSKPVLVSSQTGTAVFPWIAAGAAGRVAVAWYGTEHVGEPDKMPKTAPWYVHVAHSANAHGPGTVFTESRASGIVHEGPICTGGIACAENEADRDLLDFLMAAVMPDGRVAVVYGNDEATSGTATQFVLQTGGPLLR